MSGGRGGGGAAGTAEHASPKPSSERRAKPYKQVEKKKKGPARKGYDPRQGRLEEPARRREQKRRAPARRALGPGAARRRPWCWHELGARRDPNQRGRQQRTRSERPPTDRPTLLLPSYLSLLLGIGSSELARSLGG